MSFIDHIIGLVETRVELLKLDVKEETSYILAMILVGLLMGLFLFFTWFFLAMGLGLLINWLMESSFWGIIIIGGTHLVIFVILFVFREKLGIKKIIRKLIEDMFDTSKR